MEKDKTAQPPAAKLSVKDGSPPDLGKPVFEREIPSDPALVAPLVLRATEYLSKETLILPKDESKIGLCLEEALQNAIIHGNKLDFKKKVRLSIFRGKSEWKVLVSDEGKGFDPEKVKDPLEEDCIWGESGRGLYLMTHYMDRIDFYKGGSTVVMTRRS